MSENIPTDRDRDVPFASGPTILPSAAEIAATEKAERDRREDDQKKLLLDIQGRQADANTDVARLNRALVAITLFVGFVSWLQFQAAKQSADAALEAVKVARDAREESDISTGDTLIEMASQSRAMLRSSEAMKAAATAEREQVSRLAEGVKETHALATAAQDQATSSKLSFSTSQRPWVKVSHRIVKPLSFDFVGAAGPAATMTVEATIENVGPTVALNVLSWADVIPNDYEDSPAGIRLPSNTSAMARMGEWCGINRNSEQSRTVGSILFPHSPVVELSGMGPLMSKVSAALERSPVKGQVSFVMVGCVCYRSSFEDPKGPNHQLRFIYELGVPQPWGGWLPFVAPTGAASDLRLVSTFRTFTAD